MHTIRNTLRWVLISGLLLLSAAAHAGITIHYEGQAADTAAVERVLAAAADEAKRNGWKFRDASSADVSIKRLIDEKDVPYRGPLRGIVIQPHPDCEPIYLQFDSSLFMQDFVKTQFAGPAIHVQVIELFRKIQPLLVRLKVDDEGEYWESANLTNLQTHMRTVDAMMVEIKKSKPGLRGPVTLPSGRIVDLIRQ